MNEQIGNRTKEARTLMWRVNFLKILKEAKNKCKFSEEEKLLIKQLREFMEFNNNEKFDKTKSR